MEPTGRDQIPVENVSFYSRTLVERSTPYLVHTNWAQVRDIPGGAGTDVIKFRKYGNLTAQTTPLTEGVTPTGKQLSVTDVTVQVKYYGDYVTLTDKVQIETLDPILTETAMILGDQAGDSVDQIVRDVLAATTTIQYASSATATNEVTAAMVMNHTEVKEAVRTLKVNLARPITSRVDPSTGYNTMPIKASYVMIVHPNTSFDIESEVATGYFTPVEKYANKSDVMPNEIGAYPYVRVVETTNGKVLAASGADSNDVYVSLIFGANAYAISRISSLTMRNIVKPLGSGGTEDPLEQRATSGWKLTLAAKILQMPWILAVYHGVSA